MDLLEAHFRGISDRNLTLTEDHEQEMFSDTPGFRHHLCYPTFKRLFEEMEKKRAQGVTMTILETGSSAWGTQSTLLFDAYVKKYGGRLYSVDIDPVTVDRVRQAVSDRTRVIQDDSVHFLSEFEDPVDVVYLDSYDLDWYDYTPSADHGLREYTAIRPKLTPDALVLIDDTPKSPYWMNGRGRDFHRMSKFYEAHHFMPGKGLKVLDEITPDTAEILAHQYQLLFQMKGLEK